jgi:hypothetical protein
MSDNGKYDPRRPHDLWLDCFADYPTEQRPAFVYRRTTADEWEQLCDVAFPSETPEDTADKETLREWTKAQRERIYESLLVGLLGVKNQVNPVDGQPISSVTDTATMRLIVNPLEAQDLLAKRIRGGQLTAAEKKGSASSN